MNAAFDTYRYIARRMKAAGIKKGDLSLDCSKRIFSMAERALELHWHTKKRTEELHFVENTPGHWVGELRRIN